MPLLDKLLIENSDKILIAFSGGKDSVVLLDILSKTINKEKIAIAHIDHEIRESSYKDALFSKEIAKKYKVKFFEKKLSLSNLKSNTEAIAREKRYQALYEIAKNNEYDKIATAHTKSDNIEQFFIKLYRGSSLNGLGGIKKEINIIIRPLLDFTSNDIKDYIKKHHLKHIEDETNKESIYLRNKIRNEILPELNIPNYDLNTHIINLMKQINKDNEYFNEILEKFVKKIYNFDNFLFFDNSLLLNQPDSIKSRFIHLILLRFFNTNSNYNKITDISNSISTVVKIQISKELNFYSDKNYTAFVSSNNSLLSIKDTEKIFNIIKDKISYFRNCNINELLINENIKLINFKNGDKFKKYNNKTIKLKDIFIDHKIPVFLRKSWPLLSLNEQIIAIPFIEKGNYYNPSNKK